MANAYADQTRMGEIHGWHVYLLEEEGGAFCKIGSALTINYRLSGLKSGNPRPLILVRSWHFKNRETARAFEKKALDRCGGRRLICREWIRGSAAEIVEIIHAAAILSGDLL